MAENCEDLNTVKSHPEADIGEPWGAWRVLGAALEASQSNYYCKFSLELRITPEKCVQDRSTEVEGSWNSSLDNT